MALSGVKEHFEATGDGTGWRSSMPFDRGANAKNVWDHVEWPIVMLLGCATGDDAHLP